MQNAECKLGIIVLGFILAVSFCLTAVGFSADDFGLTASQVKCLEVTNASPGSMDLAFTLDGLDHQQVSLEGKTYDYFSFRGEPEALNGDAPQLPTVVRFVSIPPQSGVSLRINNLTVHSLDNANPLTQTLSQAVNGDSQPVGESLISEDWVHFKQYTQTSGDGFWPSEIAVLGRPAILRGYRLVPVIIHPVRYNPTTGQVQIIDNLDLQLDFDSNENLVNLVENPDRIPVSRFAYEMMKDLVINPPAPPRDLGRQNGSILYVCVDDNNVVNELTPLVEWRRRMGWTVTVHRTRQNGNRDAVRNEVRDYYRGANPPEFVCIVGDAWEANNQQLTIACHVHANVGNPYETDHPYAMLDGDDILPDVALGRIIFDAPQQRLRTIVQKTIQYESDPLVEGQGAGWQLRGAVASCNFNQNNVTANTSMLYCRDLMIQNGFTNVEMLLANANQPIINPTNFITTQFGNGISLFLYRGVVNMDGFAHALVNDNVRNPRLWPLIILATCNTGDFLEHAYNIDSYIERFLYHANGGAIGAIGTGGASHTYYNNLYSGGCIRGFLAKDINYSGWVVMSGKLELYRNYMGRGDTQHAQTREENWLTHTYIYNLMGDPAVDLYSAVPRRLIVEHPQNLRAGETHISVNVAYDEQEEDPPAEGVTVCLYRAGVFQQKAWTDAEGNVEFDFNPDWARDGAVFLTTTGHNLKPVLDTLRVVQAQTFIGANGFALNDQNGGDGDGTANPTERLVLTVPIRNFGQEAVEGALTAALTTADPTLEVIEGEARFDAAPEPGQQVEAAFEVIVGGAHSHGLPAVFDLNVQVGENAWSSSVSIPVTGPQFKFVRYNWVDDEPLEPGEVANLNITVRNVGTKNAPELTATLGTRSHTINAPRAESRFAAVNVNAEGSSQEPFQLSAHPFHLRSVPGDLFLVLQSEAGFVDTVDFSVSLSPAERDDPVGPDKYGYVAFDNFDENWFQTPQYEWIEIDSRNGGAGQNLNLVDRGMNQDVSVAVDLPFVFQYYGQEFQRITVFSNGYIAMGAQEWANERVNRFIPSGLVVSGMIAPFWDDLVNGNDGAVFTWFNADENYFVVEWSRMRRLMGGQSPEETFQVILFDPEFHPSFTGDGDIIFQYANIRDLRDPADAIGDTPYATVGIGSPDMSDGLQYVYWNRPSPGADTLTNERAIRFTTMLTFDTAYLSGVVTDAATGEPMEGVLVQCTFGFWDYTDAEGMWEMPEVLVDTNSVYTLTATKQFYNDSTITDIHINANDTLRYDFGMLHPEFTLDFEGVDVAIQQNYLNDFWVPIQNTGNGPLTFDSRIEFRNPNPHPGRDNIWNRFLSVNITNAPVGINGEDTVRVGNTWVTGVAFVDSLFYIPAGGNDRLPLLAKIYRFDRNGVFVDSLAQPWTDRGLRGLCYDGEFIWGGRETTLYKFNKMDMSLVDSFETEPSIPCDVTVDRENRILYICGTTSPIYAYDFDGNLITSWNPRWNAGTLRKYGLAWYPDQPDSLKLMIFLGVNDTCGVVGFNPVNGDLRFLRNLAELPRDTPIGIDVTDRWNSSVWTFIATFNQAEGDRLAVYELEPNTTWLSYEPISGIIEAQQETMLYIRVEAGERPFDRYWVYLCYSFNAFPGSRDLPVSMRIVEFSDLKNAGENPQEFSLKPNWPNPFNPVTTIKYNLPEACEVCLEVFDTQGRLVTALFEGKQTAGEHQIRFDASGLPNGVFIYRLQAGGAAIARKMVLIK